jgi:hypothetical protein
VQPISFNGATLTTNEGVEILEFSRSFINGATAVKKLKPTTLSDLTNRSVILAFLVSLSLSLSLLLVV